MRILSLLAASALLTLSSCTQLDVTAQAAYAQLSLDGHFGYVSGNTTASIDQDIEQAFGLGSEQGTPVLKAAVDLGGPHFSFSGFVFEDEGTGTLTADFGNNLTAGTVVQSEFDLTCAKFAFAWDIPIGPVTIAPGLAVDYIDLTVNVRDTFGAAVEEANVKSPIPMLFLRAEADVSIFTASLEVAYAAYDSSDVESKLLDVEALVELNALGWLNLFAGYRMMDFQTEGVIDDDTYDIDLGLSGFMLGGGIRF